MSRNMRQPSELELKQYYITEKMTISEISKILNMAQGKIYNFLKKYDIPTRNHRETGMTGKHLTEEHKKIISMTHKGKKWSEETLEKQKIAQNKGIGRKELHNGYVRIYFPSHPKSDKRGWILEHDLIMECNIGRWLDKDEVVHHKNGIKDDNRLENLELMKRSEHMKLHMKKKEVMTY